MKIAPEITYRNVEKTVAIDSLVQEKIDKLEKVCSYISSCHIAIEKIHDRPSSGSPYRVRIDITVPPGQEIVAESSPGVTNQYVEIDTVIRDAFSIAQRQVRELARQQRDSDKSRDHSQPEDTTGLVIKLFREQGYGFIKSLDGQDIYFHRNSVLHDDFERIEIGTGVRFFATEGDKGLQASTVQIVDKPGHSVGQAEESLIAPPLGWKE